MAEPKTPKKDREADKRRDDLAKRVLAMPPQPKVVKKPKAGEAKPSTSRRED